MSSATSPLWKTFRDHPDQRSGPRRKVIAISPERLIGITPES